MEKYFIKSTHCYPVALPLLPCSYPVALPQLPWSYPGATLERCHDYPGAADAQIPPPVCPPRKSTPLKGRQLTRRFRRFFDTLPCSRPRAPSEAPAGVAAACRGSTTPPGVLRPNSGPKPGPAGSGSRTYFPKKDFVWGKKIIVSSPYKPTSDPHISYPVAPVATATR